MGAVMTRLKDRRKRKRERRRRRRRRDQRYRRMDSWYLQIDIGRKWRGNGYITWGGLGFILNWYYMVIRYIVLGLGTSIIMTEPWADQEVFIKNTLGSDYCYSNWTERSSEFSNRLLIERLCTDDDRLLFIYSSPTLSYQIDKPRKNWRGL